MSDELSIFMSTLTIANSVVSVGLVLYYLRAWRRETIRHREAMRRWRPVIRGTTGEIIWRYGASFPTEERARANADKMGWLLHPGETLDVEHMTPAQMDEELKRIREGK